MEEVNQLPLISFRFLSLSSSPDSKESLRSADSVEQGQSSPSAREKNKCPLVYLVSFGCASTKEVLFTSGWLSVSFCNVRTYTVEYFNDSSSNRIQHTVNNHVINNIILLLQLQTVDLLQCH